MRLKIENIVTSEGILVHRRAGRGRMDICAATVLPLLARRRLARQIRQDIWRALQKTRGFSPVIEIDMQGDGLAIRAGGQCDAPVPRARLETRLQAVLDAPENRRRWINYARIRRKEGTKEVTHV